MCAALRKLEEPAGNQHQPPGQERGMHTNTHIEQGSRHDTSGSVAYLYGDMYE